MPYTEPMTNTTTAIRDTRNGNSTDVLTEQLTCGMVGLERTAALLLRLPYELRTIARQERTYRLNMIGGRPSHHLAGIVDDLLAGRPLTSPTACAMLESLNESVIAAADLRALERDLA